MLDADENQKKPAVEEDLQSRGEVSVGSVEAQKKIMAFSNMSFADAWDVKPKSMKPTLDTDRAQGLAASAEPKPRRRRLKKDRPT